MQDLKQVCAELVERVERFFGACAFRNDNERVMAQSYHVYILTNKSHTLYIGVTNNLIRRVWEHKNKYADGFTKKYNINKLIYYEEFNDIIEALGREKQLKSWRRKKKIDLIKTINPKFSEITLE
jgi:putative endonuclease